MTDELKRKLFHLCALIYVAGIIYLPRPAYLIVLAAAFAVAWTVERCRLSVPAFNAWFVGRFGGLLRPEEQSRMSGVVWMLAGVFITVALLPSVTLSAAAVLYLIFGDGVASLAGKKIGGPHWPGSRRRPSGTFACLVACVIVGVLVLRPAYGWSAVVVGAAAATLLEMGVIPLDDNFTIPAGTAVVLWLFYGRIGTGF